MPPWSVPGQAQVGGSQSAPGSAGWGSGFYFKGSWKTLGAFEWKSGVV